MEPGRVPLIGQRILRQMALDQALDRLMAHIDDGRSDIGRAHETLKTVLAPLNYRNLDEVAEFKGANTTTEFLTRHIHDRLAEAARAGKLGREGRELFGIRVTISESHVARAYYEAPLW